MQEEKPFIVDGGCDLRYIEDNMESTLSRQTKQPNSLTIEVAADSITCGGGDRHACLDPGM